MSNPATATQSPRRLGDVPVQNPTPPATTAQASPSVPLRKFRVKHIEYGHMLVEAVDADDAKTQMLRKRFPAESRDQKWLDGMRASISFRVAEVIKPAAVPA